MNNQLRLFLLLFLVIAVSCSKSDATHKSLVWDSNTEPDMKEYRVYQCVASPCLASGTPFATVAHVVAQPTHQASLPDLDRFYVVYAVDTALNVSAPSVTVAGNLQPPNAPANVRIQ